MFTICALVILRFAFDMWQINRRQLAVMLFILALAFLANVFYVATSRTFLVVIPVLLIVFGYQVFGWKGAVSLVVGILVWQWQHGPRLPPCGCGSVHSLTKSARISPPQFPLRRANDWNFGENRLEFIKKRPYSVTARVQFAISSVVRCRPVGNGGGGIGQSAQSDVSGRNSTRHGWDRGAAGHVDCTLGVIPI